MSKIKMLKEKYKKIYGKIKTRIKSRAIAVRDFSRRHFPLVLAIVFLIPAGVGLYLFISWRLRSQIWVGEFPRLQAITSV